MTGNTRPTFKVYETKIRRKSKRFRKPSEHARWYFTLESSNGEVQFTSQLYVTRQNAERGIRDVRASVKQNPAVVTVGPDGQVTKVVEYGN